MEGGDSNVKAGSYYKLTRKGNHIELTIDLVYSGDHGYDHTLKVRYSGELPENSYFPSETGKMSLELGIIIYRMVYLMYMKPGLVFKLERKLHHLTVLHSRKAIEKLLGLHLTYRLKI